MGAVMLAALMTTVATAQSDTRTLAFTVRDFSTRHPNFEDSNRRGDPFTCIGDVLTFDPLTGLAVPNVVESRLDPDTRKPRLNAYGPCNDLLFDSWFRDPPANPDPVTDALATYCVELQLTKIPGTNTFRYSSSSFFPIDGVPSAEAGYRDKQGVMHNYHFTMEAHTYFKYRGGEVFHFTGDDDVWVFINGKLAVDLGGTHPPASDSIDLDRDAARLGITKGKYYTFDMFYCERHTTGSNLNIVTSIDLRPATELDLFITDDAGNVIPLGDTLTLSDDVPLWNLCAWRNTARVIRDKCQVWEKNDQNKAAAAWVLNGDTKATSECFQVTKDMMDNGAYPLTIREGGEEVGVVVKVEKTPKTARPVADPAGTEFSDDTLLVALRCATEGAVIYYTTDGSVPGMSDRVYEEPLAVTANTIVKARAVHPGYLDSEVMMEEYTKALVLERTTAPNPFSPGVSRLPEAIVRALARSPRVDGSIKRLRHGTIIRVTIPNGGEGVALSGRASIYDAVGNLVGQDIPLAAYKDGGVIVWDGRNRNGRFVGGGTYMAVVSVELPDGQEWVFHERIGVKR
jgi:fibro-slime domain-containing protein